MLLERKRLTCGTTWHAAGLVGQLRATANLTKLAQYTTGLYAGLEAETGQATGFRRCGGVTVARTADRLEALRRTAATAQAYQIECELIVLVREKIGPIAAFKIAITVARLPKTRSGKILRGTMKKIADGDPWTMPATIDDPAILTEIGAALKGKGVAG